MVAQSAINRSIVFARQCFTVPDGCPTYSSVSTGTMYFFRLFLLRNHSIVKIKHTNAYLQSIFICLHHIGTVCTSEKRSRISLSAIEVAPRAK